jgi:hypothetical protein
MIDSSKKITYTFAKCLKMYSFFAFAFTVCKKCYFDPKKFFREKYQYVCKNQEFLLISNWLMPAFTNAHEKKFEAKNQKKCTKTKILKIFSHSFWL